MPAFRFCPAGYSAGLLCFFLVTQSTVPNCPNSCIAAERADVAGLKQVLQRELDGEVVDRRALLTADNKQKPEIAWHAGLVQIDDTRERFEDLKGDKKSQRYKTQRNKFRTLDSSAHKSLAAWCERNGEPVRAVGHWQAVLMSEPGNTVARRALGQQFVNGRWFSAEDMAEAGDNAGRISRDLTKWLPNVSRIARGLNSKSTSAKLKALKQLEAIDDPAAVPALEMAASESGERVFIDKIASFGDPSSCTALARLAVDGTSGTRDYATAQLSVYPPDFYVPDLLSQVVTPIESQSAVVTLRNGSLALHRLAMVEVAEHREVHHYVKEFKRSNIGRQSRIGINPRQLRPDAQRDVRIARASIGADDAVVAAQVVEQAAVLNSEIASLNAETREANERIFRTLRSALNVDQESDAHAWWSWWMGETESYIQRKPLVGYQRYEESVSAPPMIPDPPMHECLVRGTLVQTSVGLKPVDQIEAGELVMSQDIETGELGLKPVFAATRRPAGDVMSIDLGDNTIQATPGHAWFVSGRGWVRTKQVKPGMMIHTARGNVEVKEVSLNRKPEETFNLIVADTHTYFVGQDRLLSFDNTPIVPTARPLPGYGRIDFASK